MILGLDPGCRKCWYAIIDRSMKIIDAGIFVQDHDDRSRYADFLRMQQMADQIITLLKQYQITSIGIEQCFFTSHNQSNAEYVFGLRAIVIGHVIQNTITLKEYTPTQLKKSLTWNGRASKNLVQSAIMRLYKIQSFPQFDDAADALALAYLVLTSKTSIA